MHYAIVLVRFTPVASFPDPRVLRAGLYHRVQSLLGMAQCWWRDLLQLRRHVGRGVAWSIRHSRLSNGRGTAWLDGIFGTRGRGGLFVKIRIRGQWSAPGPLRSIRYHGYCQHCSDKLRVATATTRPIVRNEPTPCVKVAVTRSHIPK